MIQLKLKQIKIFDRRSGLLGFVFSQNHFTQSLQIPLYSFFFSSIFESFYKEVQRIKTFPLFDLAQGEGCLYQGFCLSLYSKGKFVHYASLLLSSISYFFCFTRLFYKQILDLYVYLFKIIQNPMMSSEVNQSPKSFLKKRGDFIVKISLQSIDGQTAVLIQLKNEVKMQFFSLTINKDYLLEYSDLSFCFQTPQELFFTLLELFDDVSISDDGLLTFDMKLNASKLKKKTFKLQIQKQEIDKTEMMLLKLQSLKKQIQIQSAAKDQKISLQTKQIQKLEQTTQLLRQQINQMKKQAEEIALEYKKKDFKINNIVKQSDLQRQEIAILRKSLEQFHKKFSLLQFYNFFDNPHWHYFRVYRGEQSVIIIKKDNDNIWHNFIRNIPLSSGKTYQFKIRQMKTNYRNIMSGIITKESFGIANCYKERSCIAYNSYNGNVWEKGNSRKGGTAVRDGQIITIQINLIDFRVVWFVEGKKSAQTVICEQFRNREIFLCLQVYNIEDQLELMLY